MKILIVPMAAVAQTEGPFSRAEALAKCFLKKGMEVALCAGEDRNSRSVEGVTRYPLSVPSPWACQNGLPLAHILLRISLESLDERPSTVLKKCCTSPGPALTHTSKSALTKFALQSAIFGRMLYTRSFICRQSSLPKPRASRCWPLTAFRYRLLMPHLRGCGRNQPNLAGARTAAGAIGPRPFSASGLQSDSQQPSAGTH